MRIQALLFLFFLITPLFAIARFDTISVSKDLKIIKLSDNSFIHVSYIESEQWGAFYSNGFIFVDDGEAILMDTPMTPSLTKDLVEWIKNELHAELVAFIPNHWHADCLGGLPYLDSIGVPSYANAITQQIAQRENLTVPRNAFSDSLVLDVGGKKAICRYFGPAHSQDNIVIWMPCENILFAGCMVKDIHSINLGHTADGYLEEWPNTLQKVLNAYGTAKFVIPGHGSIGNAELIKHTLVLLQNR